MISKLLVDPDRLGLMGRFLVLRGWKVAELYQSHLDMKILENPDKEIQLCVRRGYESRMEACVMQSLSCLKAYKKGKKHITGYIE